MRNWFQIIAIGLAAGATAPAFGHAVRSEVRPERGPYVFPFESCGPTGPNGEVICTWNTIIGAASGGVSFAEHGRCDVVRSQRPFWVVEPVGGDPNDPRLEDPAYKAEYDWVVSQLRSTACSCCHSSAWGAEASSWDIDAPGVFLDQMTGRGLAILQGEFADEDAELQGALSPEENFGFTRNGSSVPTTDVERFTSFFKAEMDARGITQEDIDGYRSFPGEFFRSIKDEESVPCEPGLGIRADGTMNWGEEAARYILVMQPGSENPMSPPTRDVPEGTLWKLNIKSFAPAVNSGLRYGETVTNSHQRFPLPDRAPEALVPGQDYKFYVLRDVTNRLLNCTFTYPVE